MNVKDLKPLITELTKFGISYKLFGDTGCDMELTVKLPSADPLNAVPDLVIGIDLNEDGTVEVLTGYPIWHVKFRGIGMDIWENVQTIIAEHVDKHSFQSNGKPAILLKETLVYSDNDDNDVFVPIPKSYNALLDYLHAGGFIDVTVKERTVISVYAEGVSTSVYTTYDKKIT